MLPSPKHDVLVLNSPNIVDVETGRLEDRMDSYFLSETCKYLYLLFDEDNQFIRAPNFIFTTEAHMFPIFSSAPSWSVRNRVTTSTKRTSKRNSLAGSEMKMETVGTCAAVKSTYMRQGLANMTAVLDSMFQEEQSSAERKRKVEEAFTSLTERVESSNAGPAFTDTTATEKSSVEQMDGGPFPQPKMNIQSVHTVALWGVTFTVYVTSGYETCSALLASHLNSLSNRTIFYQGDLLLSDHMLDEQFSAPHDEDWEAETDLGTADSAGQETRHSFDNRLNVIAVQALFGPFFSGYIGHTIHLIYVPHEMCHDQGNQHFPSPSPLFLSCIDEFIFCVSFLTGFHMRVEDSFGRVLLIPRGGCTFAEKATQLANFYASGKDNNRNQSHNTTRTNSDRHRM